MGIRKDGTPLRKAVYVGRPGTGVAPNTPHVGVEVVDSNEEDVGSVLIRPGTGGENVWSRDGGEGGLFHEVAAMHGREQERSGMAEGTKVRIMLGRANRG